jgi:hypothetical protein
VKTLWSKVTSQQSKFATISRCNAIKAIEGLVVVLEIVARPRSNQQLLGFLGVVGEVIERRPKLRGIDC